MSVFFISDVHLGLSGKEEERAKEDTLLRFLKHILPTTTTLFIAGDLFDFWFEYKTVIPKGFHRTLSALQEFTDRGIPVHYLTGNHDYWTLDFFETELGCIVHSEPFEIAVDGKRVFLHHGDGLAKNDLGYRLIKPVLRSRLSIWLYRWLHPDLGVQLARGSSRTSRQYTAQKHYGEEEGMIEYATKKISEGVDIVVMGHRHQPNIQPINNGTYVNLGDWITHHTYAELVNGKIELKTWNG
ncbi:MAG: UDP-2,3-diacylglucosamine diphosphatase [Bacteroidota bacterium]